MAADVSTVNKIDSALIDVLNSASDDEMIPVSIWFQSINETVLAEQTMTEINSLIAEGIMSSEVLEAIDSETGQINAAEDQLSVDDRQLLISIRRRSAKELYLNTNELNLSTITSQIDEYNVIYICSFAPNVVVELRKDDIMLLNNYNSIDHVYYYYEDVLDESNEGENLYSSSPSTHIATINECHTVVGTRDDLTGEGIKVGMIEGSLPEVRTAILSSQKDQIHIDPSTTKAVDAHTTAVAAILVGKCTESGKEFVGMLPDADLYCTTVNVPGGWKAGLEWLVDSGVNVINISHSLISQRDDDSCREVSRWVDHIAYEHNIVVVAACGYLNDNVSPNKFTNNIILVGAINFGYDSNDNVIFEPYATSAYSSTGKYYPHIVGPGNTISMPSMPNGPGMPVCGNSAATPFVVGAIAQLMELSPTIISNPTLAKSLVMAGANGEKSGTSTDTSGTDMDRLYGAGVVNIPRSISCLSTSSYSKMYTATHTTQTNMNTSVYVNINRAGNVRMALNWQSRNEFDEDDTNHESSEELISNNYFSFYRLQVTAPNGEVYTSFDVASPFQLLVFNVPNNNLGTYSVTLSRYGPGGYTTDISLAIYGCEYIYYTP